MSGVAVKFSLFELTSLAEIERVVNERLETLGKDLKWDITIVIEEVPVNDAEGSVEDIVRVMAQLVNEIEAYGEVQHGPHDKVVAGTSGSKIQKQWAKDAEKKGKK